MCVRALVAGSVHAIVVTNQTFADLPPLPDKCIERSKDLASLLSDPDMCGLGEEHVVHLVNATCTDFEVAVNRVAHACSEASTVLLYLTTRSGRVRRGLNRGSYIMMSDTVRAWALPLLLCAPHTPPVTPVTPVTHLPTP